MTDYFITGVGTGVGKTFVTAALTHQLRQRGFDAVAYKPIVTGWQEEDDPDTSILARAMGQGAETFDSITPWKFADSVSPHAAAAREGRSLHGAEFVSWAKALPPAQVRLVEGVGGLLVPINERETMLDWMQQHDWPVMLVGASYLGALNHTLLSAEALLRRGMRIRAVIISESCEPGLSLAEMEKTLQSFLPASILIASLPRIKGDNPWQHAPELTHLLEIA